MTILLYGQDNFRSRLKLKEIIDQYQKVRQSGLNLFIIDFKTSDFSDFKQKMESTPLFLDRKFVILLNLLDNKSASQEVLTYLSSRKEKHKKDIVIFFHEGTGIADNPLFSFLKKTGKSQEFRPLSASSLSNWINKEIKSLSGEIDPLAAKKLGEIFGNDLWQLSNELKKLAAFKKHKRIRIEDIETPQELKTQANIFKTIEAIASAEKTTAMRLLNQHLERGDAPIYLLNMIIYQFRNILIIKNLTNGNISWPMVLKESKLNQFVAKKCYLLAKRFSASRLKDIYSQLLSTDLKIKTGKVSPRQGLELLVAWI